MPKPELTRYEDGTSLSRIHLYLYHEYQRMKGTVDPAARERVGVTLDVLSELSRELRARGELTSPTMSTD